MNVTLVTTNATADDACNHGYTDADTMHRDIYADLRQGRSLDKFCELVGSQYSKAYWSKWERDPAQSLTRAAANELRLAVGLPALAPTVVESMADVDPDAEVWRVGDDAVVHRVVKIATASTIAILSNGVVEVREALESPVTPVTSSVGGNDDNAQPKRPPDFRPRLSLALKERILADGRSLEDIINAGLEATDDMD